MNFYYRFVSQEDVVFDIGANVGAYMLLFARRTTRGRVIAIEPETIAFARLKQNVQRNRLDNRVDLVNKALGDKPGSLHLSVDAGTSTGHNISQESDKYSINKIEVPCTTLDELFVTMKITRCDFVKIDVEGYEEHVMMGGKIFFQKVIPKAILFEANGRSFNYGSNLAEAFKFLTWLGYRIGYYRHDINTIELFERTPPSISSEGNYFAFSSHFINDNKNKFNNIIYI